MRRLLLTWGVAGAILVPATPAFAHGAATSSSAYRVSVTGISTPERGLTVRAIEAGARLELTNETGHSVEVLGVSGEPYLDVRPDGVYRNTSAPTSAPSWLKLSSSTTVRWSDARVLAASWEIPLRVQVRVFAVRGTRSFVSPPLSWAWWAGSVLLLFAALAGLRRGFPLRPALAFTAFTPLAYAVSHALDGGTLPLVLLAAGALGLAAAWRHPPFFLTLSGLVLGVFGGLAQSGTFGTAVLPAAGPGWLVRTYVLVALGLGGALAVTGFTQLRATLKPTSST